TGAPTGQIVLLHECQKLIDPTTRLTLAGAAVRLSDPSPSPPPSGQAFVGRLVIEGRNSHLLEIIGASDTVARFANFLNRRQQEADQDGDNRNHDEEFDQSKARGAINSKRRSACVRKGLTP